MKVILSPAKTMKFADGSKNRMSQPCFLEKSQKILDVLKQYSANELGTLMKMNEKLAKLNYDRYQEMNLIKEGIPAIFAYDGIQYKSMQLTELSNEQLDYLNDTIRILSGMYGMLKPYDSVQPYRLEMQQKGIQIEQTKNLYEFWKSAVYQEILTELEKEETPLLVNLASSEYSKLFADMKCSEGFQYVTCTFKVSKGSMLKIESTASKKARGQMVQYIAKNRINDIEGLMKFNIDDYEYREDLSTLNQANEMELIFVKKA